MKFHPHDPARQSSAIEAAFLSGFGLLFLLLAGLLLTILRYACRRLHR